MFIVRSVPHRINDEFRGIDNPARPANRWGGRVEAQVSLGLGGALVGLGGTLTGGGEQILEGLEEVLDEFDDATEEVVREGGRQSLGEVLDVVHGGLTFLRSF